MSAPGSLHGEGMAGRLAGRFVHSKLSPLLILGSVLLGLFAVWKLPREEEPQIKVPMIDVMVSMPGASAREVEERVTTPMEKLLWEIPGVEYLYSTSSPGESLVIVRFRVGAELEDALIRLNQKLQSNFDRIPPGVGQPLIKATSIDDVPILALTLHSAERDRVTLRQLAAEVEQAAKRAPDVAATTLIGGESRVVRIEPDPARLAAAGLGLADLAPVLERANRQGRAGELVSGGRVALVETDGFLRTAEEVERLVIGVRDGRPVYLGDVAQVEEGPDEPVRHVMFGRGAARGASGEENAVTVAIAKRPGTNAVRVARAVLDNVEPLRGVLLPEDVGLEITRHYGETAAEKSNELLFHMLTAVLSVSLLILLVLGWRESLVVGLAIPSTLALTLLVFYLYGYTLNRITLFALIFSIGILVDDAIVVVENIVRHLRLPANRGKPAAETAVRAVSEVGNPTVLATWAVIAAILPMAAVGGLMGPYMRPIPVGASAAMLFSLFIAFTITPWASVRILGGLARRGAGGHGEGRESGMTRLYRRVMGGLLAGAWHRWGFLAVVTLLLAGSMALVAIGFVKVKMLPFDNKSEFQVIVDAPEGTPLENTLALAREMAAALAVEPEVRDYQIYAGTASPFNFNGLVRHYFLRRGANVADIQVNLVTKHERDAPSHEVAKRVRPRLAEIARRHGAAVAVAEVPPGPPVLQTLVAEVYGRFPEGREALAGAVEEVFRSTEGVVDVDRYGEEEQQRYRFEIDREKAALHGIDAETVTRTLRLAVGGMDIDLLHDPRAREPVAIRLRLPEGERHDLAALRGLRIPAPLPPGGGAMVPLGELVTVREDRNDRSIYHKNLMPVSYVVADVAGSRESPVYAILEMNRALERIDAREFGASSERLRVYNARQPAADDEPSMKWDGEWQITIEVFRDLGLAFGVVLILIYILMVGWFRSFVTPLVVMAAIPFSLIGILPAHGLMGAFFTATSMIGFMAGAGIVVRNSIILVDFIELRLREGMALREAVVDAGAVRFRPMLLTAMAMVVGAAVILADPIFQGLAISLMAGEVASLLVSRMAVPVLYYMAHRPAAAGVGD